MATTKLKPGWLKKEGRAVAAHCAKRELKDVEWQIKNIDICLDQLKHNRELAVMRRDALLRTIKENSDDPKD